MTTDSNSPNTPDSRPYRIHDTQSLGAAIRYFRQQEGLTQRQLADRIGISRQYLSQLENGLETEQLRATFRALRALNKRLAIHEANSSA